ncbi:MAG: hypothetical protein AB1578_18130 [Thermodesulfobacteriota bacterium]
MSAADLLRDLRARGVELTAEGDLLRWRAPPGVVTEPLMATMRQHKAALLALLDEPRPRPYLDAHGDLRVPFDAAPALQWWRGGKSVLDTLDDLDAPAAVRGRYEHLH